MTMQLIKTEAAQRALEEAKTIDEVKDVRDKAEAIRLYAKQAGLGKQMVDAAAEIKLRAERKGGEILTAMKENGERHSGYGDQKSELQAAIPILADIGIEPTQAHRWQLIASIPQEAFERTIAEVKADEDSELTTSAMLKLAKSLRREETKKNIAAQVTDDTTRSIVFSDDAYNFLSGLEPQSADLLITDPPYMTDVDDIVTFVASWVPLALSRVKTSGRAYICTGAYPQELKAYLDVLLGQGDFTVDAPLVWTYRNTLGPSPKMGYKLNWQAIFHLYGKDAPPLECPIMVEQFSVQDINAPDGRLGDRLHTWQKPDELAERLIRHGSREGDLVIDPFAGTGTFMVAASRLNRVGRGCDIDNAMLDLCRGRGLEVRSA